MQPLCEECLRDGGKLLNAVIIGSPNVNPGYILVNNKTYPEIATDYDPETVGEQVFVQDCAVCCRPWTVTVHVGADGDVTFDVQRS